MKTLLAVVIAGVLIGAAYGQGTPGNGQPVGPKTTGPGAYSPANSPFRKWTTKQLQQRRLDLYRQVPQTQTNLPGHRGEPVFIHHGGEAFSDQQKEIYAIEGELNYRYQHGDNFRYATQSLSPHQTREPISIAKRNGNNREIRDQR